MKHSRKSNPQAITLAVGQFLKETRNGKKVSMQTMLANNGVHSGYRARTLLQDLLELGVIKKHRDNTYSVEKNMMCEELMPKLLNKERKPYTRKVKMVNDVIAIPQEEVNPLEHFSAQDLVDELRERGYTVQAHRQIITIEEL